MSWQSEISELVAYGRRLGLTFEQSWAEAVGCVEVPPMCCRAPVAFAPGQLEGQLSIEEPEPQSVLAFFRDACRRSWEGEEVAPAGCFETVLDVGGTPGVGRSRQAVV